MIQFYPPMHRYSYALSSDHVGAERYCPKVNRAIKFIFRMSLKLPQSLRLDLKQIELFNGMPVYLLKKCGFPYNTDLINHGNVELAS